MSAKDVTENEPQQATTVGELIAVLEDMPPDSKVMLISESCCDCGVVLVRVDEHRGEYAGDEYETTRVRLIG